MTMTVEVGGEEMVCEDKDVPDDYAGVLITKDTS